MHQVTLLVNRGKTEEARAILCERLRGSYETWYNRLETFQGLTAMCEVNEGFSLKAGVLTTRKDRRSLWQTLADVLQYDAVNRERIWYYHDVAVNWMQHPHVNALASSVVGIPCLPTRADRRTTHSRQVPCHPLSAAVEGYKNGVIRPPCPEKPEDLPWNTQACPPKHVPGTSIQATEKDKMPLPVM